MAGNKPTRTCSWRFLVTPLELWQKRACFRAHPCAKGASYRRRRFTNNLSRPPQVGRKVRTRQSLRGVTRNVGGHGWPETSPHGCARGGSWSPPSSSDRSGLALGPTCAKGASYRQRRKLPPKARATASGGRGRTGAGCRRRRR
jgi:hypothetical protein